MKKVVFFFFLWTSFNYSQDLTCKDFREGVFISSVDDPIKIKYEITRKGNYQVEVLKRFPKEIDTTKITKIIYAKLDWIDDCKYKLMFDTTKTKLDKVSKFINENGGVLAEIVKIEGRCFYYKSSMNVNGKPMIINGILCKK